MKRRKYWRLFIILLTALLLAAPARAQTDDGGEAADPIPLVHTVQEGENLTYIAESYGVTVADLQAINNLPPEAVITVGQELIIPGGEGEAVATTYTIQAGDTLAEIAAVFYTTPEAIAAANRLITLTPDLVVGDTLPVISRTGSETLRPVTGRPYVTAVGDGVLAAAAQAGVSPAALAAANDLAYPYYLYPGQRLRVPGESAYRPLPGGWVDVQIRPLPIQQGNTLSIYVDNVRAGLPTGSLAGQTLRFEPYEDGFVALVGLDAFTEPGLYTLALGGSGSRPWTPLEETIRVADAGFGTQYITIPEELSYLLAPEIRAEEDAFLSTIYTQFTPQQRWEGAFQQPVPDAIVTAPYGDGRSYNEGPIEIFHTGIDFAGAVGTPITAPANGVVVFSDVLELRGNTIILDHGLGVMTAYFHLSEMSVAVGDEVTAGQVLGAGGSTGLSSGPHLHWELRVMDVPVNSRQWLQQIFP